MTTLPLTTPLFDDAEIALVRQCLRSGWVTQGPMTAEFERRFAARHRLACALATTSCTAALHLATMALELGPGDEVIVPAFTWVTSAHAVEYVGATPIFADIDLATFNIDPRSIRSRISSRTKAIVAVHLFGKAAPMREIREIANERDLRIIEDAACAVGTMFEQTPVGALGDVGCFSFHPRKVITTGEGGMVTTNRPDLVSHLKALRNHGATGPKPGADPGRPSTMSQFDVLGYNLRLSDIQAAVGLAQMEKLDALLEERRRLAGCYFELLQDVSEIATPTDDCGHTYQSYVIRLLDPNVTRRDAVMDYLAVKGIQTRPGTHAVHLLGYYVRKYGLPRDLCPSAATAQDTTITLPMFPNMKAEDQRLVIATLKSALAA